MVEAAHDGEADGEADSPAGKDSSEAWRGVMPVLAVQDGGGHSKKPVHLMLAFPVSWIIKINIHIVIVNLLFQIM